VYCPTCGTQIDDFPCLVCGNRGVFDPGRGGPSFAGWWLRVGATFVDNLILFVPTYLAFLLGDYAGGFALGAVFLLATQGCYLVLLLSRPAGQTIGNRLVGTRVRDLVTGEAISRQQAVRRWLVIALYSAVQFAGTSNFLVTFSLLGLIDCLYPLFNPLRQTWHDRLARTVVVV